MTCDQFLAQLIEPGCTHPWAPPNPWGFVALCAAPVLVWAVYKIVRCVK